MFILRNADANTEGSSSTPSSVAPSDVQQDDKEKTEVSSTEVKNDDKQEPKTMGDVVEAIAQNKGDDPSTSKDDKETPPAGEKPEPTTEEGVEQGKSKDDSKLPFHEHPRWKEVLSERDDAVAWKKENEARVQAAQDIEAYRAATGVNDEQFKQALEIIGTLNTDPVKALQLLSPIVEHLQQYNGERLPEDLQKKVDAGVLAKEDAKELASLRAERTLGTKKQELGQQQQQHKAFNDTVQAINDWDKAKRGGDPDFKPKANGEPDGKWEFVQYKFNSVLQNSKVRGQQDALAILEQAYKDVTQSMSRLQGGKKPLRTLTSSGSAVTAVPTAKSMDDIIDVIAGGGKVRQ